MATTRAKKDPSQRRFPAEKKDQAVRLVRQLRVELGTEHGTIQRVAHQLGSTATADPGTHAGCATAGR